MHEVGEWVESSVVDVGFMPLPSERFDETLVTTDELCVLVPQEHRLNARHAVTQRDLREESFILEKTQCMCQCITLAGFELNKIKIRYRASDNATIFAMVREGLGVSLLPRMMLPKKLEGVVALPLEPPQQIQIGLVTRSRELVSQGAKVFIQTAMAWTQEQAAQFAHPSREAQKPIHEKKSF